MKKINKNNIALVALFAVLFSSSTTYAKILDLGLDSSIKVDSTTKAEQSGNQNANNNDSALETKGGLNVNINSNTDANSSNDTQGGMGQNSDSNSSATVNSSADLDLDLFSKQIKESNASIQNVKVSADTEENSDVEIVFKHRGKLFGFIPVYMQSKNDVETDANGTVQVTSRPAWWSFLVAKTDYNKKDIESRLSSNATIKANAKAKANASAKAEIAQAMAAELKASTDAYVTNK